MGKIVLASASPRRKELIKYLDREFIVLASTVDEVVHPGETPKQVVKALAFEKALDVQQHVSDDDIVIGSDTIVYLDEIFGKPKDKDDAISMLRKLNGKEHDVVTGLAVLCKARNIKIVEAVTTKVTFRKVTDEKIQWYVNTEEPFGKAGAYAIQGYGSILVEKIEGDYFNIVGLPVAKLDDILEKYSL